MAFGANSIKPNFVLFFVAMSFITFMTPIFPGKHVFKGLVIQGGSRGTNLLVSFGTKLDIIFNKISVNVLTCQLGLLFRLKVLKPGQVCHAPFNRWLY